MEAAPPGEPHGPGIAGVAPGNVTAGRWGGPIEEAVERAVNDIEAEELVLRSRRAAGLLAI